MSFTVVHGRARANQRTELGGLRVTDCCNGPCGKVERNTASRPPEQRLSLADRKLMENEGYGRFTKRDRGPSDVPIRAARAGFSIPGGAGQRSGPERDALLRVVLRAKKHMRPRWFATVTLKHRAKRTMI